MASLLVIAMSIIPSFNTAYLDQPALSIVCGWMRCGVEVSKNRGARPQREKGLGETLSLVFGNGFGLCLSLAPTSKSLTSLFEASKTRTWTLESSGYWVDMCRLVICR